MLPQQFQIGHHLLGSAKVRLCYNFQQGYPAAVEVAPGLPGLRVVVQLACILLHMDLMDADGGPRHLHPAVAAQGGV